MRFADVAQTSRALTATRSRTAKASILADLLAATDPAAVATVVAWLTGELPQGSIGVGWRTLYSVREEIAARPGGTTDLSVADVDDTLTELAGTVGAGSSARRTTLLRTMFGHLDADERDFLTALLTGELRQGALAGVMVDAIVAASGHSAASVRRAHMLTGSLPVTATLAMGADGAAALAAVGLRVGRAVSPMLATPASDLASALATVGPDFVIDYKLDGARIQVHRNGADVWVFTRTLHDVTDRVPDLVALVLELPVRSVILDGETLTLHDDGRPRPFQETMSRFGSAAVSPGPGVDGSDAAAPVAADRLLAPFFFDCLHLDGVDLIDRPLAQRLAALDSIAPQLRIPSFTGIRADDADAILSDALAAGHEGVMVKSLGGAYIAGRRGKGWQKVKPVHTLDLVVLAAEWGSGRRTGWLSNLHLGARDPDGGPPIMVGKTFKGLTDELLRWQTEEFARHEDHRDAHTVYLRPEIVVEIALDGAQRSSRYPGGVALRFARVQRYRPDKTPAQADTIDAVRTLLR